MSEKMKVTAAGEVDGFGPFFWGTHSDGRIKFYTCGLMLWRFQILLQWMETLA